MSKSDFGIMQVEVCCEGHGRGRKAFDDVVSQHQSGDKMRGLVGMMIEAGFECSGGVQQSHYEPDVKQEDGE